MSERIDREAEREEGRIRTRFLKLSTDPSPLFREIGLDALWLIVRQDSKLNLIGTPAPPLTLHNGRELADCPFCGFEYPDVRGADEASAAYISLCSCGAASGLSESAGVARERWNRRASSRPLTVERLAEVFAAKRARGLPIDLLIRELGDDGAAESLYEELTK